MQVTISNVSETSVFAGQPVALQVSLTNDSGSTATIVDVLLQAILGAGPVCTFTRNGELPATLANGETLVIPFGATFYASVNLYPPTKVYETFTVEAVAKTQVGSTYAETSSDSVTINAINPSFPSAAQIQGSNLAELGANLTSKRRTIFVAMGL